MIGRSNHENGVARAQRIRDIGRRKVKRSNGREKKLLGILFPILFKIQLAGIAHTGADGNIGIRNIEDSSHQITITFESYREYDLSTGKRRVFNNTNLSLTFEVIYYLLLKFCRSGNRPKFSRVF